MPGLIGQTGLNTSNQKDDGIRTSARRRHGCAGTFSTKALV
jgi:hypothetical protein